MIWVTLFICGLCALTVNGHDNRRIIITNSSITVYPNDYIAEWTSDVETPPNENSIISMTFKIAQDLPADLKVHSQLVINKMIPMAHDDDFCDVVTIDDGKKRISDSQSIFPTKCPFPAGAYSILRAKMQTTNIPRWIPDCHYSVSIVVYHEDITQPWARVDFEGKYSRIGQLLTRLIPIWKTKTV